jgi:hypothetical protein
MLNLFDYWGSLKFFVLEKPPTEIALKMKWQDCVDTNPVRQLI